MFAITKASTPSLCARFVLCMKGTVLENFIVLTFKKCSYFGLVSLFYLNFSNDFRKWVEATNDLELYFYFPDQKFRLEPPCKKWQVVLIGCMRLTYSFARLLQSLYLFTEGMNTISYMIFTPMLFKFKKNMPINVVFVVVLIFESKSMVALAITLEAKTGSASKNSWTDERSNFNWPKRSEWRRRF